MVEEEVVAVVGEVIVAAEEDLVHLSQPRGVNVNEDNQDIDRRHITQRAFLIIGSTGQYYIDEFNPLILVFTGITK
jgi:hypothetical protein